MRYLRWVRKYHLAAFLLLIAGSTASLARAEQLTLTAFDYPPYMDESLPSKGVFCELVTAAYKATGYDVSFRFYPLARSTQYVLSGAALGQLGTEWNFPSGTRETHIISVPLFYYRVVGFYRKDRFENIHFQSLSDLTGYRISVIRGSSDALTFKGLHSLNVEEVSHGEQMFKKLYANRSDIGFMAELSGISILKRDYPGQKDEWIATKDMIQGLVAQVVFSKKYQDVERYVKALQRGITIIRQNGVYTEILEKYYDKGRIPQGVTDISQPPYTIPRTKSTTRG